jgi:hypothetical protein
MTRRAFFSFKYDDVARAMVVRNSWVTQDRAARGFIDAAEFEELQREGRSEVESWIDEQLRNTSVTVVLVGAATNQSRYIAYEIEQSIARGNGLLGVDVSKIRDFQRNTTTCCGAMPSGYPFYRWNRDDGYLNLGDWIEEAAREAGR